MVERASINQKVQIGAESTSAYGTPVAASKLLQCFDWTFGINGDVLFYRPTGRKYNAIQIENTEWVDGTVGGKMDYNGIIYPLSSIMGSVSPVAHGASSTAKDWIFNPSVSGTSTPQTYTIQQGDTVRAHQLAYGIFTDFGYNVTRKDITVTGKTISQPISDGATLTSSPTAVALAPVAAKQVNIYLDPTSGALGTTQLTRALMLDFSMSTTYGPFYAINRTNLGFTAHVDLAPTCVAKLRVEADSSGMALLGYLQSGVTYFLRMDAQGATIDGANAVKNEIIHDMAVKVGKPSPFQDDQGIYAIEWELTVVEDSSWGHAQLMTVTNLITAL